MNLIKILKALADENRLRVLNILAKQDLCVCEMESVLGITQSNTSRHLIKLSDAGIIVSEKRGQFVFYSLSKSALEEFPFLNSLVEKELPILPKFEADLKKLAEFEAGGNLCARGNCCGK
ncbi:MAG TPA: metalloregulator ArsR/SmtB family transcription factor [Bacillota bacterium]|jgi:ArsR family transcriptional regulator|nr:metalloregulator ArsR/SmtB family transcription factor [Bacillota bacterium]